MEKLKAKHEAKIYQKLVRAENFWQEFKRSYCEYESSGVEGGSVRPMIRSGCEANLTNQYIELLKHQLNCEEGDLSCVNWQ